MVLIADSGSTKTEWCLLSNGIISDKCITKGINPFYQSSTDILQSLREEYTLNNKKPQAIHFYGAGCANEEKNNIVRKALLEFFGEMPININSDLMAAAHSLCQNNEGIACILGTGSNSCHYDGQNIINNISPLGFIIGDEGSGAVLGKKLIADILKKQLPQSVTELFFNKYNATPAEILDNIYKKPFPNRYLAQYTKFISENIAIPELESLVIVSFKEFIERNLLQYNKIEQLKIHFTGSIAFHFTKQLKKALACYNLKIGSINQAPMEGLIQYHNDLKH
ncbi:ATPase [Carboxylicivirga sediminis]|uniref:ATPase n=1 Tax=Carboxylicivirga sediminis TaxID=2006564 RepID=A0A941EZG1_9BACT|nr:ATPase [Carboxylicivirga sediminis]MBR8534002.1 ATPase [Carboxylicivirga sediminis]